ncbi:unnamed protein product [Bemisia tabaci]|uniref:Uncharacterized protein n=1 Tax=Bemisia tabaci TaxID=7038 RepID=A0A9P0EY83_BEMTA|nr:unnamed protein product [Bemisia tabaci]
MDHLRDYSFGLSSPGDRQRETPHRKERHCMSIPNTSSQDFLTPYYMAARNSVCSVSEPNRTESRETGAYSSRLNRQVRNPREEQGSVTEPPAR